ncbi:MAG: hypothetical protein GY736_10680 [Sphingomonas sp.]|nr:hypothetical protein [Sphingomonas sp.]
MWRTALARALAGNSAHAQTTILVAAMSGTLSQIKPETLTARSGLLVGTGFPDLDYRAKVAEIRALPDRQVYLDRVTALEERYPEGDIPRPPHWTGFRLSPRRIEFWQDRQYRLHDRRLFVRDAAEEAWSDTLLYP